MAEEMTVGDIARLTGVTVRTLHHYDEIGLVSPRRRPGSGYRIYGRPEVERLQEVLFLRELGFGLDETKRIIEEPTYARTEALRSHRRRIEAKLDHFLRMLDTIDAAITAEEENTPMTNESMLEVFGGFDPTEHQQEAEDRWGHTDAFRESARRTARYTPEDWKRLQDEGEAINTTLLTLRDAGVAPESAEAMDLAERHRAHISRWFYDCTPEIHRALGQMYVADSRFRENIDRAGEGLAAYLSAAITANADR